MLLILFIHAHPPFFEKFAENFAVTIPDILTYAILAFKNLDHHI
ncbi:hypothetical protein B4096_2268 [Heyndrickxia coagulans]|uniref:Uncharacterized protein n=1 Tax=Heyndrickxia coagulans TaxID=1398 RepID=A0A133L2W6_HEYCO|nr:hypothetical protein HMPREF3213_00168 [Heyndrickxia coagulans]KYC79783.1 hypothetical protein B4096_2268 [Heyndrickxia coagulans]